MLNTNNTVNYETNIKQKEKKYSWSTVFSWLYLKTIGRILPKKWNKWAENILYYNKATGSDEIRTDKTTDESAQIDLKPEVTVKESQSEIVSEDEKVQTTFQNTTMQTECVETTDRNIGADLKPEVAEKGSQSEIISKDGGIQTDKITSQDAIMQTECVEKTDKNIEADLESEVAEKGSQSEIISKDGEIKTEENSKFTSKGCFDTIVTDEFIDEDYDSMEEVSTEEDEELNKQLEDVSQELGFERLQNVLLKEENEDLESKLAECEKDYTELEDVSGQLEEELSAELKEKSKLIFGLSERLIECNIESLNEIKRPLIEVEKDMKINSLMRLNEGLDEDKKEMEAKVVEDLSKEWELAGIDDSLKKVFLDVIGMLEKELLINNQEQQLQEKKVDLIERLKAELKKESDEALQETREKLAEQEKLIEQLKKEQQQAEKADIKKLQEEKENMEEQLKIMQQQLLNNQEQQKLEEKLKSVDKRLEDIDEKTKKSQEQTKAHKPDTVSTVSTVKSTTGSSKSTLSKLRNLPNKLFRDKGLNNFLSRKNEELKKDFPEFKEQHFCHNVLDETIQSLLNKNSGKFESKELLKLLENNLKQFAREILKDKVKKLDPGKNKKMPVQESAETRMKLFSDKIQELQLTSSIRDKFLSPDQKMCSQIPGEKNKYRLTEKAKKEYTPNSSMSHTNTVSVHLLNAQRVA